MDAYLDNWAKRLRENATGVHRNVKQLANPQQRAKPLAGQITDLMNSLPPALRDRPWNMGELVSRLQGKYRDRPHPQNVGAALRALGWKQKRCWSRGFNGVRLWVPPPPSDAWRA